LLRGEALLVTRLVIATQRGRLGRALRNLYPSRRV
jgi:hypothetical protein